ncbi:MAG: S1-like domain-containing RNA-binding protein [Gammaproteobacteria bacterium]
MITLGKTYTLNVVKTVDFGVYLNAGELGEVLLPKKYAPRQAAVGDTLEVFLYRDSEDRPVATTQTPRAQVGEFAYLKVVAVNEVGAFLDWGLDKDVLLPYSEQHRPVEVGHSYLVYLYINHADGRITASSKVDKFLNNDTPHHYQPQQAVDLIIANSTDLGYKAIINHRYWGVLYKDEVFQRLSFGQSIKGYIKRIRPDGKIDLTLHIGPQSRDRHQQLILDYLNTQGGFAPLHDKSDPAVIYDLFAISKGAFKKAIGGLFKQGLIEIGANGIRLTEQTADKPTP